MPVSDNVLVALQEVFHSTLAEERVLRQKALDAKKSFSIAQSEHLRTVQKLMDIAEFLDSSNAGDGDYVEWLSDIKPIE